MELLKQRILQDGRCYPGGILKVDSFINHQMDPMLMYKIAEEFIRRFQDRKINKIVTIDKSGIFRSLMLFREHRLVHVLEDGDGGVKYELCLSHDEDEDEDMHVHFYCEQCHRLFCLHDMPVPQVDLPEGYSMTTVNYVVKGTCPQCAERCRHEH